MMISIYSSVEGTDPTMPRSEAIDQLQELKKKKGFNARLLGLLNRTSVKILSKKPNVLYMSN